MAQIDPALSEMKKKAKIIILTTYHDRLYPKLEKIFLCYFNQGLTDTGIRRIHGCRIRYPSTDTDTDTKKLKNGYGYGYKKVRKRIRIRKSQKTDTDTDTKIFVLSTITLTVNFSTKPKN